MNAVTIKDAYPIPRIEERLSKLVDAKILHNDAFGFCILVSAPQKTSVKCELGLFKWKRMPFGLCNATAIFLRLMTQALTNVTKKYGNQIL